MEWKSESQRKILEKTIEIKIEKFNQNLFLKALSLIFQTLAKTPKGLFNMSSKTSFNCSKNTREYGKIRTKNLREKLLQMGYL